MKKISSSILGIVIINILFMLSCNKSPTDAEKNHSYKWDLSTPEEQGFDSTMLEQAFDEGEKSNYINSMLIVRNGYLIAEKYFNGFNENDAHNVRSVSKSFLSAIVGIALRENYLESLDIRVIDFFPEYVTPNIDPRKYSIIIQHLLTMKAGFDNEHNNFFQIYYSANWIKSTIELPLKYDPGTTFSYNTFQTHLLSAILAKATGMSTLDFANKYLFEPLQISIHKWEKDPQGFYFGGTDMYFTPRDMARFGYLYLNNGFLNGQQIVPDDWIEISLSDHTQRNNWNWGELKNINYGYLWWLGEINNYKLYLALGHGGQFIIVIPELNMIIVTTSYSNIDWDTADQQERGVLEIVAKYILPAVINPLN